MSNIEIPDLVKVLEAEAAKKIVRRPCHTNRASSMGYFTPAAGGCVRRGVYERANWQEKEMHDVGLQLIFNEGNHQERAILADMAAAGIEIAEQQSMYEWKEHQITGHIDGKLYLRKDGELVAVPIEIKSMSPHIFDGIHTYADFQKHSWTRAYTVQIQLYMAMQHIDVAVFVLKNKSNGKIKQVIVQQDNELIESATAAADQINLHVAAGTLPDGISDIDVCADCPFRFICKVASFASARELQIGDDPELEQKIDEWKALELDSKRCKDLWEKAIRPKMEATCKAGGGILNMVLGKYRLTGKPDVKGSFRGKAELI